MNNDQSNILINDLDFLNYQVLIDNDTNISIYHVNNNINELKSLLESYPALSFLYFIELDQYNDIYLKLMIKYKFRILTYDLNNIKVIIVNKKNVQHIQQQQQQQMNTNPIQQDSIYITNDIIIKNMKEFKELTFNFLCLVRTYLLDIIYNNHFLDLEQKQCNLIKLLMIHHILILTDDQNNFILIKEDNKSSKNIIHHGDNNKTLGLSSSRDSISIIITMISINFITYQIVKKNFNNSYDINILTSLHTLYDDDDDQVADVDHHHVQSWSNKVKNTNNRLKYDIEILVDYQSIYQSFPNILLEFSNLSYNFYSAQLLDITTRYNNDAIHHQQADTLLHDLDFSFTHLLNILNISMIKITNKQINDNNTLQQMKYLHYLSAQYHILYNNFHHLKQIETLIQILELLNQCNISQLQILITKFNIISILLSLICQQTFLNYLYANTIWQQHFKTFFFFFSSAKKHINIF